jgi:hypothetical protein
MSRVIAIIFALGATSCASVQPVTSETYESPSSRTEHRIDASYKIGEAKKVFVGEQMLRVQDYYATLTESGASSTRLTPTENFTLRVPPFSSVSLTPADSVTVTGTTERDGSTYRLITLPGASTQQLRFLITPEGELEGSAVNSSGAKMGWAYNPQPASVRFVQTPSATRVDATKGFTNFELVYGGTSRDSFRVLYREYTRDDLVRPTFSQTLTYEKGVSSIRFRNLQIEVHESTNEHLRFTVVADGRSE